MSTAICLPKDLHDAFPAHLSLSGVIRQVLEATIKEPGILEAAIINRKNFEHAKGEPQRYGVFLPLAERKAASQFAAEYTLSMTQLTHILLEHVMNKQGMWPQASPGLHALTAVR